MSRRVDRCDRCYNDFRGGNMSRQVDRYQNDFRGGNMSRQVDRFQNDFRGGNMSRQVDRFQNDFKGIAPRYGDRVVVRETETYLKNSIKQEKSITYHDSNTGDKYQYIARKYTKY